VSNARAGAILASGYWDTQSGAPTTAPGTGKYRADDWAAPALVAISCIDADGYDRTSGLAAVMPGDLIAQQGTDDSQNYQRWTVASVTDSGGWVSLAIEVAESGSAFVPPGSNQRRLLQALSMTPPTEPTPADPWVAWAPPLDPPTPGGLPLAQAQAIADAVWATDPHLAAALMWESYAATLPPSPSMASVSTGAQSVSYSPPMPGGDYGAAMARAAWHRSLMGSMASPELVLADPMITLAPPPPPGWGGGWWADAPQVPAP